MKTATIIALLLITTVLLAQDSTKIISSKAYRIQVAYLVNETTNDTIDYTDSFIENDGFIIMCNYINNKGILSIDKGDSNILFLGTFKEVMSLKNVADDTQTLECNFVQAGIDSTKYSVILKQYIPESFEETGEKQYYFHIKMPGGVFDFLATEVLTGKKDI